MEYILIVWLCLAGGEFDGPVGCAAITSEHRSLVDCRAKKRAYRDRAIELARDPAAPTITFRITPCVRTGEA